MKNSMNNEVLAVINTTQYAGVIIQPETIFKWIQLGLAIACSLVLVGYRLWKWHKEAKADGKITKDEIKDAAKIIIEGAEEVKKEIEKQNEKEDND